MATIYDIYGNILFQNDKLSLKELVEKNKVNLKYADLSGANLSGANLSYADLRFSNLTRADLRFSDLSGADLSGANLSGANLSYADLSGANLSGADLSGADLLGANLRFTDLTETLLPIYSKRFTSYKLNSNNFENSDINKVLIKIGCKEKTIKDWDNWFNSDEEYDTKRGTEQFKQIYANYVAVREYLKIMIKGEK